LYISSPDNERCRALDVQTEPEMLSPSQPGPAVNDIDIGQVELQLVVDIPFFLLPRHSGTSACCLGRGSWGPHIGDVESEVYWLAA